MDNHILETAFTRGESCQGHGYGRHMSLSLFRQGLLVLALLVAGPTHVTPGQSNHDSLREVDAASEHNPASEEQLQACDTVLAPASCTCDA